MARLNFRTAPGHPSSPLKRPSRALAASSQESATTFRSRRCTWWAALMTRWQRVAMSSVAGRLQRMRILHCLIVTPMDTTFAGEVEEVIAPAARRLVGDSAGARTVRCQADAGPCRDTGSRPALHGGDSRWDVAGGRGYRHDFDGRVRPGYGYRRAGNGRLEQSLSKSRRSRREAEKYFDRTYRQLARTLHPNREVER